MCSDIRKFLAVFVASIIKAGLAGLTVSQIVALQAQEESAHCPMNNQFRFEYIPYHGLITAFLYVSLFCDRNACFFVRSPM